MKSSASIVSLRVESTGSIIANRARIARTLVARLKGLLGTKTLPPGEALIIDPCASVHMLFMKYAIDVLFCSNDGTVINTCRQLRPWRFSPLVLRGSYVVELPAGTVDAFRINEGDRILWEPGRMV